ncbi:hypothetical protein A6U98_23885 [Rhizobium sp. WYCCWR10014]|nr:hypothetical protein A6U98_23885 [Rhizobium sp. WYCCWR10014]
MVSAFTTVIEIVIVADMTDMIGADPADATRMMLSTSHAAKDFEGRRSYACRPAVLSCKG